MTLSFSTKWPETMGELAGQPNYFIDKIWHSLIDNEIANSIQLDDYSVKHLHQFNDYWSNDYRRNPGKNHTIRSGNRWKSGMKIHPVINNRTKDRFQFAPVLDCKSVQDIEIKEMIMTANDCVKLQDGRVFTISIDGKYLIGEEIIKLALNDGFPSVEAFFQYFNTDFKGQIIHWTDLKY